MLSLIASKFKNEVRLYRDDGLTICKATLKKIEKTKREVIQVFKSNGLKKTIDANKKIINFLGVSCNLTNILCCMPTVTNHRTCRSNCH